MIEYPTIRVHYGYCQKCAEPVKLRRTHPISGEHYWKIEGHFGCSENGEEGMPTSGAKEAFFRKYRLLNELAGLKRRRKKTGKFSLLPSDEGYPLDLFKTPVAP